MARTRFHSILEDKIEEAIEIRSFSLVSGAASDYASYKENVGYISGLRDALKLCDEIESELDDASGRIQQSD